MASRTGTPGEVRVLDETFRAELVIKRTRVSKKANENGYFDDPATTSAGELATLTLHSTSLEGLQAKIKAHVDLVEEN